MRALARTHQINDVRVWVVAPNTRVYHKSEAGRSKSENSAGKRFESSREFAGKLWHVHDIVVWVPAPIVVAAIAVRQVLQLLQASHRGFQVLLVAAKCVAFKVSGGRQFGDFGALLEIWSGQELDPCQKLKPVSELQVLHDAERFE